MVNTSKNKNSDYVKIEYVRERNEIARSVLWELRNEIAERRAGKHDIYWGAHACELTPNHWKEECTCSCGAKPTKNSIFWGNDFEGFDKEELKRRLRNQAHVETSEMTFVVGDIKQAIINGRYRRDRKPKIRREKRSRKSGT